jgi:hypothetical protein
MRAAKEAYERISGAANTPLFLYRQGETSLSSRTTQHDRRLAKRKPVFFFFLFPLPRHNLAGHTG